MNENSYAGREYLYNLKKKRLKIDVLSIGSYPEYNIIEDTRCGNLWKPEKQNKLAKFHKFYKFKSLKSKKLLNFLIDKKYDIGIQGGTGIINKKIIDRYRLGILNFHPGLLPNYRGCSAPEWQIVEGNKVYSTCHLIDEGIDTGDIVAIKELKTNNLSYFTFRASIYIETSKFLIKTINEIKSLNGFKNKPYSQDKNKARYMNYIGDEKIKIIIDSFKY